MAKQGMKRPDIKEIDKTAKKHKNDVTPVPEIKGKAKKGHEQAKPMPENSADHH